MRTRTRVLAAFSAALALCVTPPAFAQGVNSSAEQGERASEIDAYLRERTNASGAPGVAYAVVTPESVEHIGTWGDTGNGQPVTETTPFLWGSVAKPVTATAVMTLAEDGALDLDRPVRAYLPSFALADGAGDAITVRQLLDQTSGIPEGTGATDRFGERSDPYGEAVADLADVAPLSPPGEKFEYSSANYLVLGAVVQAVSGRPFAEYLRDHVLDPLDMSGAITSPREARAAQLPGGHSHAFGQPVGVPLRYDETGASYGYLGGTVEDLAHFAMAHLNEGRYGSARVLDPASVATAHDGTARISDTLRYGLGWRDDDRNADLGTRMVWHTGAAPGYFAAVVLLPELNRGIVMTQNIYGFFQDSELVGTALGAARILAGGQPEPVSGDITYPLLLAVLLAVLAGAAAVLIWSLYRMFRPSNAPRGPARILTAMACWVLGGLALAHLAVVLLPRTAGADLRLVRLWAPDVGWLLVATAVAGPAVAAARLICGCRHLQRARAQRLLAARRPARTGP
ncbi:serine hydrolase domain-containing protein [Streptomyces litchfieldiae]|uniref:Serine hydrolase domain-containing protein n=1 Tax=Streptomyces litchfieldiae TaxID=3075543 RepID=A0ABU2MZ37_9ACTN|nr:serine hydrolase domain-containing protein [Streptomyces sp. DSM 44938]MDT0346911.1 serine hydrolase domain-containing protein [Streptomyces sp. DSM 44938]